MPEETAEEYAVSAEHIQAVLSKARPPTTAQAEQLAALLRPYIRPTGDGGTDE
jgi:hypothetical protein